MAQRFLTLADVAEELAVSVAQVRVLVRSGELRAIQVGGRNQWRVEASALEEYIQEQYARTRARIEAEQGS
jgi:prophage regulatory protein